MNQRWFWVAAALVQALTLSGCTRTSADEFDEVGSKSDYSVLQFFESEWRGKAVPEARLEKLGDAEVLGVPALGGNGTVWVLLKPTSSPFYKQSIEGNYLVQKALVERLVRENRVSPTVGAVLLSHTGAP